MTTEIIRVMGVVGSARKHGNTHTLVDVVTGIERSADSSLFWLRLLSAIR